MSVRQRISPSAVHRSLIVTAFAFWTMTSASFAQTPDAFFSDTVLQDVRIFINARDWQTLCAHAEEDTYYPADLHWQGITVRNVGIRSRGSGTRNNIKPGLKVDVNRYVSNRDFLGLKAFVLDNAYSDPSLVRESVTMKVFARFGLPAPREAHARLYVNDLFAGVYTIVEVVDRTFVTRNFGAAEGAIESGGYLYEYAWVDVYGFEDLGTALEPYAARFKAQTRDTDSMFSLYQPIAEMVHAINDAPDDLFAAVVGARLDLTLLMKYLAIENFMAERDGLVGEWGLNNFYLYRPRSEDRPAVLIPWDQDHAFDVFPDHSINYHLDTDVLVRRAMNVPALRQLYLETLLQCAALSAEQSPDDGRGWLEREVDRQAQQIEPAVRQDLVYPFTIDEFTAETDFLRSYARLRPQQVVCQVAHADDVAGPQHGCPSPVLP